MRTSELITRMNDYSLDHDLDDDERALYLRCLNDAYCELYLIVATGSDHLTETKDIFWDEQLNGFRLPDNLFELRVVYGPNNNELTRFDGSTNNPNFTIKNYIYFKNKIIINPNNQNMQVAVDPLDGNTKRYITITYIPRIKKLVEVVNDISTETDVPVFEEIFHYVLVIAALRHLYIGQRIFFEKTPFIQEILISGLKRFGYYKNYG